MHGWLLFAVVTYLIFCNMFVDTARTYLSRIVIDDSPPIEVKKEEDQCSNVEREFDNTTDALQINILRRRVAQFQPECLTKHFERFANALLQRMGRKQYYLHVPKTGGTSLCKLAHRNENVLAHPGDCWHEAAPCFWYLGWKGKHLNCEETNNMTWDFVANERWLDHPMCSSHHAYSISLREPVVRAMSQVEHTRRRPRDSTKYNMTDRLDLMKTNYIAWSLMSGRSEDPPKFVPTMKDLPEAKRVLSSFDYILTFDNNTECNELIYQMMGMNDVNMPHEREVSKNYQSKYNKTEYKLLNLVDTCLYEYTKELRDIDCRFFLQLKERLMVILST